LFSFGQDVLSSNVNIIGPVPTATLPAPTRFTNFLLNNKWNNSVLPLSYKADASYWKNVKPDNQYTKSQYQQVCGRDVTADELNAYMFQTEQFLTMFGINLYDAACREIALSILGKYDVAQDYETQVLVADKTLQFGNIRGSTACKGIMATGACNDTQQNGACGFCYSGFGNNGVTLDNSKAYFFRMISDVYSYGGTVDARCPEKKMAWAWNDWRPVAGENAWANFLGPLTVAYLKAGKNANGISDSSSAMKLATGMFAAFQTQQMPNGAIAYAPWNTYDDNSSYLGATASTENGASALAGLKAFLYVLQQNSNTQYKGLIPQVQDVINKLTNYIKSAYDPSLGYFLQGGSYDKNWNFHWNRDPSSMFAVDCQTWVISVLGAPLIDSWFGAGTTLKIWENTKLIGGYSYDKSSDTVLGVGFTNNQKDQIFSGEWSFGAVNMLKILANQIPGSSAKLLNEAAIIRQGIDDYLTFTDVSINSDIINYANTRYWIPWGWYANPLPSTASISWAVMTDSNYNPFLLGGAYASTY